MTIKENILDALITLVVDEIGEMENIYNSAVIAVQKADGRMQSRYDTQRYDYAQEAESARELIELKRQQLQYFQRSRIELHSTFTKSQEVSLGNVIEVKSTNSIQRFLITPAIGGIELPEYDLIVISAKTPVAEKLKGHRIGEVVRLPAGDVEIVGIY